jgi:cytoskeletal protein CcmA (bactofilin family)
VKRALLCLLAVVAACALIASPADAADFHGGRDRLVVSGDVNIPRGVKVDTVVVIDGDVNVAGTVTNDVINITGHTRVYGHVQGDVVAITDRAHIEPGARVDGDVVYAQEKPVVSPGAQVGGDVRHVRAGEWGNALIAWAAIWLAMTISTLLLGLALLWIAPRAADAAFEVAGTHTGQSIAAGLGVLIGLPILAVLLLLTVVGIPLAILLFLLLIPLAVLGYANSAWLLGRRIVGPPRGRFVSFLAGLAILRLVALVPVLGGLVWAAAAVFGIGTLAVAGWRARSPGAPPAEPAAAPAPA